MTMYQTALELYIKLGKEALASGSNISLQVMTGILLLVHQTSIAVIEPWQEMNETALPKECGHLKSFSVIKDMPFVDVAKHTSRVFDHYGLIKRNDPGARESMDQSEEESEKIFVMKLRECMNDCVAVYEEKAEAKGVLDSTAKLTLELAYREIPRDS